MALGARIARFCRRVYQNIWQRVELLLRPPCGEFCGFLPRDVSGLDDPLELQ